jgi:hypothetical protein
MNTQHVKTGLNLDSAEKKIMGKSGNSSAKKSDSDPVRIYAAEMTQLAEELGINLLEDNPSAAAPKSAAFESKRAAHGPVDDSHARLLAPVRSTRARPRAEDLVEDISFDDGKPDTDLSGVAIDEGLGDPNDSDNEGDSSDGSECSCDSRCESECDCDCHYDEDEGDEGDESDEESGDDEKVDDIISRLGDDLGINPDSNHERKRHQVHMPDVSSSSDRHRSSKPVTSEQDRRRHINSVMADIRGETRTSFGVERERLKDLKATKLEEIDQLRASLKEQEIDCKSVGNPTSESDIAQIDAVLDILRLKNDRNRYSSVAEELILGGAEFVETVLDGSRAIPILGWRPDYTGYSATVNAKLHRMRYETSQIVGNVIKKYNVGHAARMGIELLPSFFLYPRQQRKQQGTPGLANEPHVADARYAYAAIRAVDEPKNLDDARQL